MAESVIPYHDHGRFTPAVPDVMGELAGLRRHAQALEQDDYVRYVELLAQVYEASLREAQTQRAAPDF